CPLPEALETVESLEKGIKEEELSKRKIQYRKMYQWISCTHINIPSCSHQFINEQGRSQIPDSPAKPPTQRGSVSNNTPNSTLLQTDAAWREDLHLAGLGWIVGEGTEKVSILAHCHYVNSPWWQRAWRYGKHCNSVLRRTSDKYDVKRTHSCWSKHSIQDNKQQRSMALWLT
ncbi:unnamed protein product, partial [Brassica oleracea var. botrytis]